MSLLTEEQANFVDTNLIVTVPRVPPQVFRYTSAVYDYDVYGGQVGVYQLPLLAPIIAGDSYLFYSIQTLKTLTYSSLPSLTIGLVTNSDIGTIDIAGSNPFSNQFENFGTLGVTVTNLKFEISNHPLTAGKLLFKIWFLK